MPDSELQNTVETLLAERLGGLAELEVLLFLRQHPAEWWPASFVAQRMFRRVPETNAALTSLCSAELVVADGGEADEPLFCYRPTPDLAAAVSALADLNAARPAEVMRVLSGGALDRIRSAAALAFGIARTRATPTELPRLTDGVLLALIRESPLPFGLCAKCREFDLQPDGRRCPRCESEVDFLVVERDDERMTAVSWARLRPR